MNTSKQPMLELALSIATEAHRGQFDKAGIDYIEHPIFVASQVDSEEEKAVTLLHDVIEDSSVTDKDLERFEKYKKAIDYLSMQKSSFYAILVKTIIEERVNDKSR